MVRQEHFEAVAHAGVGVSAELHDAEVAWIPGFCGKLVKASYGDPECRHFEGSNGRRPGPE